MGLNPYKTDKNPNHPGVMGLPLNAGVQPANQDVMPSKVDSLGTGTFPPESQGQVGRSQPAGLSAQTQYGLASPGVIPGESTLSGPLTHPLPTEAEGDNPLGLAPKAVTRESMIEEKQQRLRNQLDQLEERKSGSSDQNVNTDENLVSEEEVIDGEEDDDEGV